MTNIQPFAYNKSVGHLSCGNETFWFIEVIDGTFSRVADCNGKRFKAQTVALFAK